MALSRAQNLLTIVGNRWGLEKVEVDLPDDDKKKINRTRIYERILKIIRNSGGIIDGRDFV